MSAASVRLTSNARLADTPCSVRLVATSAIAAWTAALPTLAAAIARYCASSSPSRNAASRCEETGPSAPAYSSRPSPCSQLSVLHQVLFVGNSGQVATFHSL